MSRVTLFFVFVVLAVAATSETFSENWMGTLRPVINHLTILDLSLPGSHDTMTYDLSRTISDGANDMPTFLSYVLHDAAPLIPWVGSFTRVQAKTQGLDITAQLDAGIRFLDFRVMLTKQPLLTRPGNSSNGNDTDTPSWEFYCMHMMESEEPSVVYLREIRAWLDKHPTELIIMWFSRHGGENYVGQEQYPGVTIEQKQEFWAQIESIFSGLLMDTRVSSLNSTSFGTLLDRGYRVLVLASDYEEFTGASPYAMDAATQLRNDHNNDLDQKSYESDLEYFASMKSVKRSLRFQNRFLLRSMAASAPIEQIERAFLLKYEPFFHKRNTEKCVRAFGIPEMNWCPPSLQSIGQLMNYYKQLSIQWALDEFTDLPNAFYMDAVDVDGTLRTGTTDFGRTTDADRDVLGDTLVSDDQGDTKFSYTASLALFNARKGCARMIGNNICEPLLEMLVAEAAKYPVQRWEDPIHGRQPIWPQKQ